MSLTNKIYHGDAKEILPLIPSDSIDLCYTSPSPYLFGGKGIGSETTQQDYIDNLEKVFTQVYRVLKPQGCAWVNLTDFHDDTGSLTCTPEHFVLMMRKMGWLKRSNTIWVRTEKFEMQEDYSRFTRDWENIYFFTKSRFNYFHNPRSKVLSSVMYERYQAPRKQEFESGYPQKLIERALHYSAPHGGIVLDTFAGTGTLGVVAKNLGYRYILIELSEEKCLAMQSRLRN